MIKTIQYIAIFNEYSEAKITPFILIPYSEFEKWDRDNKHKHLEGEYDTADRIYVFLMNEYDFEGALSDWIIIDHLRFSKKSVGISIIEDIYNK